MGMKILCENIKNKYELEPINADLSNGLKRRAFQKKRLNIRYGIEYSCN
jgi:hypothetical protein